MDLINKHHLHYLFADPHQDRNDLPVLFEALAKIDPLERRWMLGFVSEAIGARKVPADLSEDAASAATLKHLHARCAELLDAGMADFFLAYAIVAYVCNVLRSQGDLDVATASIHWLQGAMQFFQKRADASEVSAETAATASRRAEEAINNRRADSQLFRDRYHLFCDTVVKAMLPPAADD